MKRWIAYSVALLLVAGGVFWWVTTRGGSSATNYTTAAVEQGDLQSSVTATGTLDTVTRVDVGSEVSGVIKTLYVDYNSIVKQGQLLAQIDPQTLQAQVDQVRAGLQRSQSAYTTAVAQAGNARAGVKSAQAGLISAQAKVEQARSAAANARSSVLTAEANVRKAQADRDNAKRNYDQLQALRKQDLISQDQRDVAYSQLLSAEASLDASKSSLQGAQAGYNSARINIGAVEADTEAARISIDAARDQLAAAEAQAGGAQADVKQSMATLQAAQVNLGRTSIRSPIDGIVLDVKVSEGQTVAAQFTAPSLFVLARDLDQMQVTTTVDEADIGGIKTGAPVTFTVDAWPDQIFSGKVDEVRQSAITTNNVVTYPVIVRTSNPGLKLKPGMTATVSIAIDVRKGVLMVPTAALRFLPASQKAAVVRASASPSASASPGGRPGGKASPIGGGRRRGTVYTLDPADPSKPVAHRVVPGLSDGVHTEIRESDLKPGDLVITGNASATATPKASTTQRRPGGLF